MKNETVIQDYLFSSSLLLKTIAILLTWYALHTYAGLVYERNLLTRFLVQNDLTFLLAEVIVLNFIYATYSRAKNTYIKSYKIAPVRWSFNVLVVFVFLTYLWDAANDAFILLKVSFS